MARWAAGQRITAGRLSPDRTSVGLSTGDITIANDWNQWGGEEAVISDPGLEVAATARVSGHAVDTSNTLAQAQLRVAISLDGGSSWAYGNTPKADVGTGSGAQRRSPVAADAFRIGHTTGDVVAKVEIMSDFLATEFWFGRLTLVVEPR